MCPSASPASVLYFPKCGVTLVAGCVGGSGYGLLLLSLAFEGVCDFYPVKEIQRPDLQVSRADAPTSLKAIVGFFVLFLFLLFCFFLLVTSSRSE